MSIILLGYDPEDVEDAYLSQIKDLAPGREIVITRDEDEVAEIVSDIEIIVRSFPRDLLKEATSLRWYQSWSAGVDWIYRYPSAMARDFILTSASGIHAIPIAEHVMAFILGFARDFPRALRARKDRDWDRWSREAIFELPGKTMLLIGVGAIGERTAEVAAALGVRVIGVRRNAVVVCK